LCTLTVPIARPLDRSGTIAAVFIREVNPSTS
jgi:hypothetical protein